MIGLAKNLFEISEDAQVGPEVKKHFKRNFIANFFDVAIFFFGDSFVAAYTILPVFVSTLTNSPILIALVPAVTDAGWFIPQLFTAPFVERQSRLKSLVIKLGSLERISYLLLAIGAFVLPRIGKGAALPVILFLVVLKGFSGGLVALPWQEIIAKVIPVSHRGRFYGWSMLAGKVLGILGAACTGYLLVKLPYPGNYSASFFLGFVLVALAMVSFSRTVEPEKELTMGPKSKTLTQKGRIKEILFSDIPFRNFLVSRIFSFLGYMAFGLFSVYSIDKFSLPKSYVAVFTVVLIASGVIGYGVFGVLGDKKGNKLVFALSDIFLAISLIVAIISDTLLGIYVVFLLIGIAQSGSIIADMNMVLEFGSVEDRPTYIGIFKSFSGPAFLLSPLIGGGMVELWGYRPMFAAALGFTAAALFILLLFVSEPRTSKKNQTSQL